MQRKVKNQSLWTLHEEDKFYIYAHWTLDTEEIFYIGKGIKNRCYSIANRSLWWNNIVNKHNYYITIIEINLEESLAFDKEKYWIDLYGRRQLGGKLINLTDGGEGVSGKIYTEQEKLDKSEHYKANPSIWKRSSYFGESRFGEDNPNYGNHKLGKAIVQLDLDGNLIGEYMSAKEAGEAVGSPSNSVSAVATGKRQKLKGFIFLYKDSYTPETYIPPSFGKGTPRPVLQLCKETNSIIKEYQSCASTKLDGFDPTAVGQVCLGKKKSHKGFVWVYKQDYIKKI